MSWMVQRADSRHRPVRVEFETLNKALSAIQLDLFHAGTPVWKSDEYTAWMAHHSTFVTGGRAALKAPHATYLLERV